jgi:hypothetical protein
MVIITCIRQIPNRKGWAKDKGGFIATGMEDDDYSSPNSIAQIFPTQNKIQQIRTMSSNHNENGQYR